MDKAHIANSSSINFFFSLFKVNCALIFIFINTNSPQTRLEGISGNKAGQFAAVLDVNSQICFLHHCFYYIVFFFKQQALILYIGF